MRFGWGLAALVGVGACSSYGDASNAARDTDAGSTLAPAVDAGPSCTGEKEPKDAPECLTDAVGVFVDSASGSDTNPGTRAAPFKTIHAATGALAGRAHLYLCVGNYDELVAVPAGVGIYGGFACGTWSYTGVTIRIAPTDRGPVVSIIAPSLTSLASELADLDLEAAAATDPGESSVGVLVANTALTVRRSKITTSAGVDGKIGTDAVAGNGSTAPAGASALATLNPGAATPNPQCVNSIGGAGGPGLGSQALNNGSAGKPAITPAVPSTSTGAGGLASDTSSCVAARGVPGSNGADGTGGAVAAAPGALTTTGWTPAPGADGGTGGIGQGGGGGAVRGALTNVVGGGGGAGGCGGAGGVGGQGGGGSIGIASFDGPVTLQSVGIVTKNGGTGGGGGRGANGQFGGAGGTASAGSPPRGCGGGIGGDGGVGGGGAGGSGGVSIGVLYTGPAPTSDLTTTIAIGTAGLPGKGNIGGGFGFGQNTMGADGLAGVAQATLAVPK